MEGSDRDLAVVEDRFSPVDGDAKKISSLQIRTEFR